MTSRAILSAAISTTFAAFVPIEDAYFPALYFLGLLLLLIIVAIDAARPRATGVTAATSAWLFVAALALLIAAVTINPFSRRLLPIEPEENISSAALRV